MSKAFSPRLATCVSLTLLWDCIGHRTFQYEMELSTDGIGSDFVSGGREAVTCGKDIREMVNSNIGVDELVGLDWDVVTKKLEEHLRDGYDRIFELEVMIDEIQRNLTKMPKKSNKNHPSESFIQRMVAATCRNQWGDSDATGDDTRHLGTCTQNQCGFHTKFKDDIASVHKQANDEFSKRALLDLKSYDVDYSQFRNTCVKSVADGVTDRDTSFVCTYFCEKLATSAVQLSGKPKAKDQHNKAMLEHKRDSYKQSLVQEEAEQEDCKQLQRQLSDFRMAIDYCEEGKDKLKKNIVDLMYEQKQAIKALEDVLDELDKWIKKGDDADMKLEGLIEDGAADDADLKKDVLDMADKIREIEEALRKVSNDYTTAMEASLIVAEVKEELAIEVKASLDFYHKAIREPITQIIGKKGEKLDKFQNPDDMKDKKTLDSYAKSLAKTCKEAEPDLKAMQKNYFANEQPESCKKQDTIDLTEAKKKYKEITGKEAEGLPDVCKGLVIEPAESVKIIVAKIRNDQREKDRSPLKLLRQVNELRIELEEAYNKDSEQSSVDGEPRYFTEFVAHYHDVNYYKKYMQFWSVKDHGVYYFVNMQVQLEMALETADCSKAEWAKKLEDLKKDRKKIDDDIDKLDKKLEQNEKDYNAARDEVDTAHAERLKWQDKKKRVQDKLDFLINQIEKWEEAVDRSSSDLTEHRENAKEVNVVLKDKKAEGGKEKKKF